MSRNGFLPRSGFLCVGLALSALVPAGRAQVIQGVGDVYYQADGSSISFLAVEAEALPVTTAAGTTNCTWVQTGDGLASGGQALAASGGTDNLSDYNAFTMQAQFALAGQYTLYWRARANVVGTDAVGADDSWWVPSEGGNSYATLGESPVGQPPFPGAWVNNNGGGADPWRNLENTGAFGVEYDWYRIAGAAGTFRGFQVNAGDLGSNFSVSFVTRETGYGVDGLVLAATPEFAGMGRADLDLMLSGPSGAPTVTLQPAAQEVALGDGFVLALAAGGTQPFTVQWRRNGLALTGETHATLVVDAAALADAGAYDAVLTSAAGSTTTDAAQIDLVAPAIDPPLQAALQTFPATFSVPAATNATYQWLFEGSPLAGETEAVLTVANVSPAQAGIYRVEVTIGGDTVTSDPAELVVAPVPTQPYPQIVTDAGPNFYWRLGEPAGSTQSAATVGGLSLLDINLNTEFGRAGVVLGEPDTAVRFLGGAYLESQAWAAALEPPQFSVELWVRSTGGAGEQGVLSMRDFLEVLDERLGFDVVITPNGQWAFRTGTGVGGEDWNTLLGPPVEVGEWTHVVCTYDGADMRMYLNGALRGVLEDASYPQTYQALWPLRLGAGENELGEPTTYFQGEMDEVSIYPYALDPQEVLVHWAGVFDPNALPLVSGPEETGAQIGQTAELRVGVISGSYPTYQWRRDGIDLPGQTHATLVFDPLLGTDGGDYDVVVENDAGSVTSRTVTLVPLADFLINMTIPDSGNTILTRNGSPTWWIDGGAYESAGLWRRRSDMGIQPGVSSLGYQANLVAESNGDLEIETTLSGLIPGELYSVWVLHSYKNLPPFGGYPGGPTWIRCGFEYDTETGLLPQWRPDNSVDTGYFIFDDTWDVLLGFLGTRTAEPDGTIAVLTDFDEANERSMLQAFGYQLTNPPPQPPEFTQSPRTQAVLVNGDISFSSTTISLSPVSYQWQKDGADLPGATNNTLSLNGVAAADGGVYTVTASNDQGSTVSDPGELIVIQDWLSTYVFPDLDNTLLERDPAVDWYTDVDQATANSNTNWYANAAYALPGAAATHGYVAVSSTVFGESGARIETTISGLDPNERYAVWVLYSYSGDLAERPTIDWSGAAPARTWQPNVSIPVGLATGPAGGSQLYAAFLGVTNPPPAGAVSFTVDVFQTRTFYNGAAYQIVGDVAPAVDLAIGLQNGDVVISWPEGGQLEQATDLSPPNWTPVPGAASPYSHPPEGPAGYWRLAE